MEPDLRSDETKYIDAEIKKAIARQRDAGVEVLENLKTQVEHIHMEPCSPAEDKLANALAVLIAVLLHERAAR